jgi:hypothetical protein
MYSKGPQRLLFEVNYFNSYRNIILSLNEYGENGAKRPLTTKTYIEVMSFFSLFQKLWARFGKFLNRSCYCSKKERTKACVGMGRNLLIGTLKERDSFGNQLQAGIIILQAIQGRTNLILSYDFFLILFLFAICNNTFSKCCIGMREENKIK